MTFGGTCVVTVLGAAGFIGSHVVSELVSRGHSVIAVSNTPPSASQSPSVQWIQVDLDERVPDPCSGTACIHLAEQNVATDEAATDRNLARARRVLAAPFERIVYVSSAVVYGDQRSAPRREDEDVAPAGAYARAKVAVERVVVADPRCAVARIANVYGRGMSSRNVLSDILTQVGTGDAVELRDVDPIRDYVHVTDVARALVELVGVSLRGIFNIGTMRGTSVGDLARIVCAASGEESRRVVAISPRHTSSILVLDVERIRRELGWAPRVTLEQGVADLIREQLA